MRTLTLDIPGYAFPMQLWPQAWAAGLRIREIPVRLIYNDPNRHFGGLLDDAAIRLQHYLSVLANELARIAERAKPLGRSKAPEPARACSSCGCSE
jgi:dolichol-phosphate mannosyltransferase